MSQRLSVVIITKNAAEVLPDCLAAVQWADEIIVLDAGSTDNTRDIALNYGAKVAIAADWQGYGIQRQRAQDLARGDYVLMIDADERVTPALAAAIRQALANAEHDAVYSLSRQNWFIGRFMRHSGWYPDRVVRLYPREKYRYGDQQVHESLICPGAKIIPLDGELQHLTCCDLFAFQQKQLNYARLWAKQRHADGDRASFARIVSHTVLAFIRTLLLRGGLLDGRQGWLLAMVNAQYTFNKYAILWALGQGYQRDTLPADGETP